MDKTTKEFYEQIINELDVDAKVEVLDKQTTTEIFEGIEEDLKVFKTENQKRVQESHEEIQKVVFTS